MFRKITEKLDLIPEIKITRINSSKDINGFNYTAKFSLNGTYIGKLYTNLNKCSMDIVGEGENLIKEYIKEKRLKEIIIEEGSTKWDNVDDIHYVQVLVIMLHEELYNKDIRRIIDQYQSRGLVIYNSKTKEVNQRIWEKSFTKLITQGYKDSIKKQLMNIISELEDYEIILNDNLGKLDLI